MKSHCVYLTIFAFLALVACNSNKQTLSLGTYFGKLPCADCPAMNTQLQLKKDSTYILKTFYVDRDKKARENAGHYSLQKDTLWLLQEHGINKFVISGETLSMLGNSGKPIKSEFSEKYKLTKKKPENFSLAASEPQNSIGFKATGNEPLWALTIDFDKKMHFTTMASENLELTTPVPKSQKAQDANVNRYWAKTEAGTLEVSIMRKTCTDDMSGKKSNYSVRVRAKTGTMKSFKEFTGCGSYLGNYRLQNLWVLTQINHEQLSKHKGKLPHLQFDLAQNKVYGFGGCNRLNGSFTLEKDSLKIGALAATNMACAKAEIEGKFLAAISKTSFKLNFIKNKLVLKNEHTKLVFITK